MKKIFQRLRWTNMIGFFLASAMLWGVIHFQGVLRRYREQAALAKTQYQARLKSQDRVKRIKQARVEYLKRAYILGYSNNMMKNCGAFLFKLVAIKPREMRVDQVETSLKNDRIEFQLQGILRTQSALAASQLFSGFTESMKSLEGIDLAVSPELNSRLTAVPVPGDGFSFQIRGAWMVNEE